MDWQEKEWPKELFSPENLFRNIGVESICFQWVYLSGRGEPNTHDNEGQVFHQEILTQKKNIK